MTSRFKTPIAAGLIVLAASAQALDTHAPPSPAMSDKPVPAIPSTGWDAAPVTSVRLSSLRGGSSVSANVAQNGSLQNTAASNVTTGANSVSGGSFANASGLPTVIQNSGANVVIQNSTVVNVLFRP